MPAHLTLIAARVDIAQEAVSDLDRATDNLLRACIRNDVTAMAMARVELDLAELRCFVLGGAPRSVQ